MRIKTRLHAVSGVAAIIGMMALLTVAWTDVQVSRISAQHDLAEELISSAFKRATLRDEYFLYHDERPKEQLLRQTDTLAVLIKRAQAAVVSPGTGLIVQQAALYLEKTKTLYSLLFENQADIAGGRVVSAQGQQIENQIRSQLVLDSQALSTQLVKFQSASNQEQAAKHSQSQLLIVVSVLSLVCFTIASSMLVARSINAPIKQLLKGIKAISTGNLAHRVGAAANDEIGDLGKAFDVMTEKLKNITVSRDELAEEIVKRREAESALHYSNESLKRSNKDLEQFAYVASHDLQEPLRMVASYTQLLAQRYEGQLDAKAKKYIDYAVDGAMRMQRLINDLLTYSRIGTRGKLPEVTDTHAVLGEALKNLAAAIAESRAMVTNDDLPTLRADVSHLVLVFQNLIGNAIKFHGQKDPLVHVAAAEQAGEWVFSVRDNGIGIEPQYTDRIFVIFQRLHTREEYPGTGIGLAVCKRIVERHGGRIWFESEPGKGSTFFFSIPKST